jgi:hypothetical protein
MRWKYGGGQLASQAAPWTPGPYGGGPLPELDCAAQGHPGLEARAFAYGTLLLALSKADTTRPSGFTL